MLHYVLIVKLSPLSIFIERAHFTSRCARFRNKGSRAEIVEGSRRAGEQAVELGSLEEGDVQEKSPAGIIEEDNCLYESRVEI